MADVRAQSGVPVAANFSGFLSPTPSTPIVIDLATGGAYFLGTGDVVTVLGAYIHATLNVVIDSGNIAATFSKAGTVPFYVYTDAAGAAMSTDSSINDSIYIFAGNSIRFRMGGTQIGEVNTSGNWAFGSHTTVSARIHAISTTEQLRIGYDAANYNKFTVDATGNLTLAAVGTNPNISLTPGGTGILKLPTYTATTFVAGDCYLVVDASGNVHRSAIGPAS